MHCQRGLSKFSNHCRSTKQSGLCSVPESGPRGNINCIFAEHIKHTHSTDTSFWTPDHTLIIQSDDLTWKTNGKPFGASAWHIVWSQCQDTDVTTSGKKSKKYVDPFLKLYTYIPLMYTENTNVPNGEANGMLCYLIKIHLNKGVNEDDFELIDIDGFWVRRAFDVSRAITCYANLLEATNDSKCVHYNMPIKLIPGMKTRHSVSVNMNRFPALTNHATICHKLQGQTKKSLFIKQTNKLIDY
jgi:hypothetical protein